jgi:hypothetical protein
MVMKSSDRFVVRHRTALLAAAAVAAVILVVVGYELTLPKSAQTTAASGAPVPENELLRVGALPVT